MTIHHTKKFDNMYCFNKLYFSNHKDYCIYLWLFFNYQLHYKIKSCSKKLYHPYTNYPFFHETENILDIVFSITNNFPIINTKKLIDECFNIRNTFANTSLKHLTENNYNLIKNCDIITNPSTNNITSTKNIQQKTTKIYTLLYEWNDIHHRDWRDVNIAYYDNLYDEYTKYIKYINKIKKTIEKIAINKILRSHIYNYGLGLKLSIKNCGLELIQ